MARSIQAWLFSRKIVDPFGRLRTDCLRVKKDEVGIKARGNTALLGLVEKRCRLQGQSPHAFLKRHGLVLSHPLPKQIGRHPGIAMLVYVRAGIGQPDEAVGVGNQLTHFIGVSIDDRERNAHLQIFVNGQIQDRINGVALRFRGNICDALVEMPGVIFFRHLDYVDLIPLVGKNGADRFAGPCERRLETPTFGRVRSVPQPAD